MLCDVCIHREVCRHSSDSMYSDVCDSYYPSFGTGETGQLIDDMVNAFKAGSQGSGISKKSCGMLWMRFAQKSMDIAHREVMK